MLCIVFQPGATANATKIDNQLNLAAFLPSSYNHFSLSAFAGFRQYSRQHSQRSLDNPLRKLTFSYEKKLLRLPSEALRR